MAIRPIVRFGDPRLRIPGAPIVRFDRALARLIDDMIETMLDAPGAGLAAHQVGEPVRLCVMHVDGQLHEVANPRVLHLEGSEDAWEGCLSLAGFRALRTRAARAVMVGQDRHGRAVRISGRGELARAIQHEHDHLGGVLYTDGLPDGAEILTEAEVDARRSAAHRRHEPA